MEVDVSDVDGSHRTRLTGFDDAVRGVQFYEGNRIICVLVGGPSAEHWPVFFHRDENGSYIPFGVDIESILPEMVASASSEGFDLARMWISCTYDLERYIRDARLDVQKIRFDRIDEATVRSRFICD